MDAYRKKVLETAGFLQQYLDDAPVAGVLVGTGLGAVAAPLQIHHEISYREIPHFPATTVPSHSGKLLTGRLSGRPVILMQGRFHLYEGYSPLEITFPVRVMHELGVSALILTNAAGGLHPEFKTGDIMIVTDHINLTGSNPLVGIDEAVWGGRFPDMTAAYAPEWIQLAQDAGASCGIELRAGVYAGLLGPSLETPAETRFLKMIGADAVGFSTVHEVIAAVQAGLRVLALSVITNINNPDRPVPAATDEIIAAAGRSAPKAAAVIAKVIETYPSGSESAGVFL